MGVCVCMNINVCVCVGYFENASRVSGNRTRKWQSGNIGGDARQLVAMFTQLHSFVGACVFAPNAPLGGTEAKGGNVCRAMLLISFDVVWGAGRGKFSEETKRASSKSL